MIEELLTLVNQNWGVVCNANIVNVLIYLNLIFFIQPVNKSNEWQLDLFLFFYYFCFNNQTPSAAWHA